jgi:hypothetical protein
MAEIPYRRHRFPPVGAYLHARPNVIYELGWFCGRLERSFTMLLIKEGTSMFSDFGGIIQKRFEANIRIRARDQKRPDCGRYLGVDARYRSSRRRYVMKPEPGPRMTLGSAAAAQVRLIVGCMGCGHQVEPDPAERLPGTAPKRPCYIGASGWSVPVRQPTGRYGREWNGSVLAMLA